MLYPDKSPQNREWIRNVKHPITYKGYLIVPIKGEYKLYDRFNKYLRRVNKTKSAYLLIGRLVNSTRRIL